MCAVEQLVPVGQEGVALAHGFTDQCSVFWTKQPGLAAGRVQMGMGSIEWLVSTRLVPTHKQFSAGRLEEATDVSCETERDIIASVDNAKRHDTNILK